MANGTFLRQRTILADFSGSAPGFVPALLRTRRTRSVAEAGDDGEVIALNLLRAEDVDDDGEVAAAAAAAATADAPPNGENGDEIMAA
jgi:hypothetical protein